MTRSVANPFIPLKVLGAVLTLGAVVVCCSHDTQSSTRPSYGSQTWPNLRKDLSLHGTQKFIPADVETILTFSIEQRNLLCASGITPGRISNFEACDPIIKAWSAHINKETERHMYSFRDNPAEFEHSEGFFRMLLMAVVLAEDYHIHYASEKMMPPGQASPTDGFFRDPRLVFLPGLLGPERKGTCSSMPVLYVAIGRKLGYPLKLVATKGHLFCRWDGNGERFNIEATAHGLSRFADEYYRHWPFEISPEEEKANGYLLSLTPRQELAAFLSIRAMCLRDTGRLAEAADCFLHASQLDPACQEYRSMARTLHQRLAN